MQPRLRSFLLGTMNAEERLRLEEEIFENEDTYEDLEQSLNDLLDEYVRGHLPREDQRLVEDRLLISERNRSKLALARALAGRERRERAPSAVTVPLRPKVGWFAALAGLAAACLAAAIWLAAGNLRLRHELRASENNRIAVSGAPSIASLTLSPRLTRGSAAVPSVPAPGGNRLLRVELATDEIYPSYSVEVEAPPRGRIWTQDALRRGSGGAVGVWLPGEILRPGSYEFLLYGNRYGHRELLESYPCRFAASAGESPTNTKPAQ